MIVFTKVPQPGFVKTRLQHPLFSPDFPSQLQVAMLLDTIKGLKFIPEKFVPVITYYPEHAKLTFEKLIIDPLIQENSGFVSSLHFVPQVGKKFTDRFKNAFKYAFQDLKLFSALIIGSDTPHIQPSLLQTAIHILQANSQNSVLGPSQEGGFYLLGHNEPYLENIDSIFQQNNSFKELGNAMDLLLNVTDVHILPEVTDVDQFEDLKTVRTIIKILSLNYERGKIDCFPEHTFKLINSVAPNIWVS